MPLHDPHAALKNDPLKQFFKKHKSPHFVVEMDRGPRNGSFLLGDLLIDIDRWLYGWRDKDIDLMITVKNMSKRTPCPKKARRRCLDTISNQEHQQKPQKLARKPAKI